MSKMFLFLLPTIVMILVSCEKNVLSDFENNLLDAPAQSSTWKEQLDYALNKDNIKTRANNSNGLSLEKYTYKGKINTKADVQKVIEQLFSENSSTVLYTDSLNFEIVPLQTFSQKAKMLNINDYMEYIHSNIESVIEVGMEIVELEWSFKGDIFYSTAIVSNDQNCIIYDHIGFMVLEKERNESKVEKIKSNIPILKSGSESGDSSEKQFSKSNKYVNFYGITLWEYVISCFSYFNENGILINRIPHTYQYSIFPYSCRADIRVIGGEIYSSSYNEFAWGYTYGLGSVSLTWQGYGFAIGGSGEGETGSTVHTSS